VWRRATGDDAQGEHHDKQDNRNADQHVVMAGPGDHQGEQ
jgi:hypothetical protein